MMSYYLGGGGIKKISFFILTKNWYGDTELNATNNKINDEMYGDTKLNANNVWQHKIKCIVDSE